MSIIVGIDVGGSTTKIMAFRNSPEHLITPITVRAGDPLASAYGAFGKFTAANNIALSDIETVMITGVGSSYIGDQLFGIPTKHATEFHCIGLGGLYLSKLEEAVVVSMGTGTAIVNADRHGKNVYMGGTGVGGGTLMGLAKTMLGIENVDHLAELAKDGDLSNIDLAVGDISKTDINSVLSAKVTAANFGKVSDLATKADLALGILNMVFESVGMLSIFAARSCHIRDIVLTGNLSAIPQASEVFNTLSTMFDMNFVTPNDAPYSTVIGAGLSHYVKS